MDTKNYGCVKHWQENFRHQSSILCKLNNSIQLHLLNATVNYHKQRQIRKQQRLTKLHSTPSFHSDKQFIDIYKSKKETFDYLACALRLRVKLYHMNHTQAIAKKQINI